MNADQIAAELRRNPSIERLIELQRECQPARDTVRARLAAITQSQSPHIPHGPARQAAIAKDVDAVLALDREVERLQTELQVLDDLESRIVAAMEVRRATDAKAAAPGARRKLPGAIAAADRALAELDKALAAITALIEPLATVASLPGEAFPITDDEAAALLELRDRVWTVRNAATLTPSDPEAFPKSHRLLWQRRGGDGDGRLVRRLPPTVHLADLAH